MAKKTNGREMLRQTNDDLRRDNADCRRILKKEREQLDKLQYESARTEDIVLTHARKKGLKDFCEKWNNKQYSDSDHNIPNMILDFIEALKE